MIFVIFCRATCLLQVFSCQPDHIVTVKTYVTKMTKRWPHISNAVGEQGKAKDIQRGFVEIYFMFLIQGKFLTQMQHCIYAT